MLTGFRVLVGWDLQRTSTHKRVAVLITSYSACVLAGKFTYNAECSDGIEICQQHRRRQVWSSCMWTELASVLQAEAAGENASAVSS